MSPSERRQIYNDHFPVTVARTTAAEYDRVQDGPKTICYRCPVGFDQRSVQESAPIQGRWTTSSHAPAVPRRHHLGPEKRSPMARFTRTISQSFNVLAAASRVDRVWCLGRSMAQVAHPHGPAKAAALVTGDGRRHVCTSKKRGLDVGLTRRGKGSKIMLMVDGRGTPLSVFTLAANKSEVHTIETLVDTRVCKRMSPRMIYDRAADADWLRDRLADRNVELICPHRRGRKRPNTQDGRKLRRYRHRWIIERTISWLFNYRKLVVRYEHHSHLFDGFVQLACLLIVLNRF